MRGRRDEKTRKKSRFWFEDDGGRRQTVSLYWSWPWTRALLPLQKVRRKANSSLRLWPNSMPVQFFIR